jgi:hypothetical protein
MSLLDAFLLDPAPLDTWVALRTDGALGSGTEDDPYDGSVANPPQLSVSGIAKNNYTATATTATNHGFQNQQLVEVSGATGADAVYYNGTFSIFNLGSNTFQYTMWGKPNNAAAGTISCRPDP